MEPKFQKQNRMSMLWTPLKQWWHSFSGIGLSVCKNSSTSKFWLITWLELLRANGIVPQNPKPLELQDHNLDTPSTFETSSEKGKHFKVKKEAESGPETEDSDEDSLREKALLVRFYISCSKLLLVHHWLCQAELEKIRKGKKLKDKRPNKKLKKEEKPVFIPGEIIDLTW